MNEIPICRIDHPATGPFYCDPKNTDAIVSMIAERHGNNPAPSIKQLLMQSLDVPRLYTPDEELPTA